jgi:hypothetical protein
LLKGADPHIKDINSKTAHDLAGSHSIKVLLNSFEKLKGKRFEKPKKGIEAKTEKYLEKLLNEKVDKGKKPQKDVNINDTAEPNYQDKINKRLGNAAEEFNLRIKESADRLKEKKVELGIWDNILAIFQGKENVMLRKAVNNLMQEIRELDEYKSHESKQLHKKFAESLSPNKKQDFSLMTSFAKLYNSADKGGPTRS